MVLRFEEGLVGLERVHLVLGELLQGELFLLLAELMLEMGNLGGGGL